MQGKIIFSPLVVIVVIIVVIVVGAAVLLGLGGGWVGFGGGAEDLWRVSSPLDDGLEAVPGVGGVLDDAHGAVGLQQRVFTAHDVAVARLGV